MRRGVTMTAAACGAAVLFHEYFGLPGALFLAVPSAAACCLCKGRARGILLLFLLFYGLTLGHVLLLEREHALLPELDGRSITLEGKALRVDVQADGREGTEGGSGAGRQKNRGSKTRILMSAERIVAAREAGQAGAGAVGQADAGEAGQAGAGAPRPATAVSGERILVTLYDGDTDFVPGDRLRVSGQVQIPQARRNPGGFDYRLYLRTKGVKTVMTGERAERAGAGGGPEEGEAKGISAGLYRMREGFLLRLAGGAGQDTADLMRAILFGDKSALDEDVMETFQKNGTAHILAVSGLHIGILYRMLLSLWGFLSLRFPLLFGLKKGKRFALAMGSFLLSYAVLAAWTPSVVRAVLMILLHVFAQVTGRRYDLWCAACSVGTAALLVHPLILFQTGFQLSFLAVLSISLLMPLVRRAYAGIFLASLTVQIGLGPYLISQFGWFSILTVFINVPVVFLAALIVPAGIGSLIWSALLPWTCPADPLIGILCRLLVGMNEAALLRGMTAFPAAAPPPWVLFLFYFGLFFVASEEGRLLLIRGRKRALIAGSIVLCLLAFGLGWAADDGFRRMDMIFVDVGQGDCLHLRVSDSTRAFRRHNVRQVLIDGGGKADLDVGKKTLRPYLLKGGVRRVDLAIVTHLHTDHYDGIRSLAQMGMVKKLCLYEGYRVEEAKILAECGLDREDLIYVKAGEELRLGDAEFDFLAPPARTEAEYERLAADEEDENSKSLLIRVSCHGVSAMMTGDLGEEGEEEVMRSKGNLGGGAIRPEPIRPDPSSPLACDILKVGHHGSKYSTGDAFLDAVDPDLAVIQVGKNNYGHPSPVVLEKLAARSIPVLQNDRQGAIGLKLERGRVTEIRTMIGEQ